MEWTFNGDLKIITVSSLKHKLIPVASLCSSNLVALVQIEGTRKEFGVKMVNRRKEKSKIAM